MGCFSSFKLSKVLLSDLHYSKCILYGVVYLCQGIIASRTSTWFADFNEKQKVYRAGCLFHQKAQKFELQLIFLVSEKCSGVSYSN